MPTAPHFRLRRSRPFLPMAALCGWCCGRVYHQIKRMFGVYGAGVNGLHRDAIGGLALDPALAPGQWRELSAEEVSKISS